MAALLDAAFATRSTSDWMCQFAGQVPAAPVLTLPDALDNPYFASTGGIQEVSHPDRPGLRVLSSPIRLDGKRARATPAPKRGADTDAILREAGFVPDDIAELRLEKVI